MAATTANGAKFVPIADAVRPVALVLIFHFAFLLAAEGGEMEGPWFEEVGPADLGPADRTFLVVDGVVSDSPAADAGFVVGERILAVAGRRCHDLREWRYLVEMLPVGTDAYSAIVRGRDGIRERRLARLLPEWETGLRLADQTRAGEEPPDFVTLLRRFGVAIAEEDAPRFALVPARWTLVLLAEVSPREGVPPGWLEDFVAAYLDSSRGGTTAVGTIHGDTPPFFTRLRGFYRRLARRRATGGLPPDPAACGVDPAGYAWNFPYPHIPKPPLGEPSITDPRTRELLGRAHRDPRPLLGEIAEHVDRLAGQGGLVDRYLALVVGAFLAPDRYTRGVYTDKSVYSVSRRRRIESELEERLAAEPAADPAVVATALAVIHAVEGEGTGEDVVALLTRVREQSPFLAWRARQLVGKALRYHHRRGGRFAERIEQAFAGDPLQDPPRDRSLFEYCAERDNRLRRILGDDNWSARDGIPHEFRREVVAVVRALRDREGLSGQRAVNRGRLARSWIAYAELRSTDPHVFDPGESLHAGERVIALEGRELDADGLAVVAACFGAAGDYARALRWGEAALEVSRRKDRPTDELEDLLARARRREPPVDEAEFELIERRNVAARTIDHHLDGVRTGPFRSWYPDGGTKTEGIYHRGRRVGRWQVLRPDGDPREEGRYLADRRFGEWVFYHPGGRPSHRGRFSGAGAGERIGVWTSYHPDGTEKEKGFYYRGRRHGTWTGWHDNGVRAWRADYRHGRMRGSLQRWDREGNWADPSLPEDAGADEF